MSDLTEIPSALPFAETVRTLEAAIVTAGMTMFAKFDHAANAAAVGLQMPPTVLLVYGNPKGGTPIMNAAPRAALDLPLRVLIREDEAGGVVVAFHPIAAQLGDAGVPEALASNLDGAQRLIVETLR